MDISRPYHHHHHHHHHPHSHPHRHASPHHAAARGSGRLRRTQSMSVHAMPADDDSSVSSLGSFPEADLVAQQFSATSAPSAATTDSSKLTRQRTVGPAKHPSSSTSSSASSSDRRTRPFVASSTQQQHHQQQQSHFSAVAAASSSSATSSLSSGSASTRSTLRRPSHHKGASGGAAPNLFVHSNNTPGGNVSSTTTATHSTGGQHRRSSGAALTATTTASITTSTATSASSRARRSASMHRARTHAHQLSGSTASSSLPLKSGTQYVPPQHKQCPHCLKAFRNSWAVPKHVSRIHDRAGELHCPRCLFKTHSPEWLQQHEKEAHRTCPYCQQLFVLLNKHVGTCPKRMH